MTLKNKDLVKEHSELQAKREEALKMPINSLTKGYIKSLGKSELEKKLAKRYEEFTLSQFLNQTKS